ncbi:hypothetical protein KKB3_00044, partial [Dehalococcoides mccartyi]
LLPVIYPVRFTNRDKKYHVGKEGQTKFVCAK